MASPRDLTTVTRLIVTFNSADVLEYSRIPADELVTLAVDNASSDDTPANAQALGYEVLNLDQNVGYANAIMAGLDRINTEFVLIANPDVQISTKAIQVLLDAADRQTDCSLFIPRIFKPDGSEFFRYETRFDPRVKNRVPPSTDQNVDTVSGAVLLVRRKPFIQHGGFDTNIFLYFEDDELSLRFRKLNQPMRFVADASAKHIGDGSSGNTVSANRIKDISFGWSWGYLMDKMRLGNRWITFLKILGKLLVYVASFRSGKARRQMGIANGFLKNLAGQPAPFLRNSK
ncbi:glycosyltransferase family 2 protein [Roseibium alexandrii]|uniref:Putative glycosyltransferase n=1 Tax=Roseibium alexandrii (strain DSM 17067 / NCIMB 14079 / DFL-11) TaxID=244592 RepID=A0A5E8H4V0_ROSAD|nr:glycosyltransferase family 2 protein [Roseibium alexandrii]EEE46973.2 putative glycosyltransferase [Roseibium alexandrii DFL-11]